MNTSSNCGIVIVDIVFYGFMIAMIATVVIACIIGASRQLTLTKIGTDSTPDTWKTSKNMTPSGSVSTYIITDPSNGQMWFVARTANGVSVIPYVPVEVKAEKEIK